MNLYQIEAKNSKLAVSRRLEPIRFKAVNGNSLEQDLEDLIVAHPGLLNLGEYSPDQETADLLIISSQPRTITQKRADLFAIDREGNLVIIEIKRDAVDEKGRKEAMEFQAIRYAAASRKMTVDSIIEMLADYLSRTPRTDSGKSSDKRGMPGSDDLKELKATAEQRILSHLADEDEQLTRDDLDEMIDPKTKQRIYLVAAGYEPDVTSACAWLREHQIPIFCFQLRPYRIDTTEILDRQRLIPPPELDEFLLDMSESKMDRSQPERYRGKRAPIDKPLRMTFGEDANPTATYDVTSWKLALVTGIRHMLEKENFPESKLAMPTNQGATVLRNAEEVRPGLEIETNASAQIICDWLDKTLREAKKPAAYLRIQTRANKLVEIPRS